jgi:hypothetical protein
LIAAVPEEPSLKDDTKMMPWRALAGLSVAVMIAVNVLLVTENRRLARALESSELARRALSEVSRGNVVPAIQGRNADGEPMTAEYAGDRRRTLLLVFSSTCPVCEENWPNWRELVVGLDERLVRIVAVDLPSRAPASYLDRHGIRRDWLVRNLNERTVAAYKLNLVPQTIMIGPGGRVEDVVTGVLTDSQVDKLRRTMTQPLANIKESR